MKKSLTRAKTVKTLETPKTKAKTTVKPFAAEPLKKTLTKSTKEFKTKTLPKKKKKSEKTREKVSISLLPFLNI